MPLLIGCRRELDEAIFGLASKVRERREGDGEWLAREREAFGARIRELNSKRIRRHNLILPGPLAGRLQMLELDAEALSARVLADPSAHLQKHPKPQHHDHDASGATLPSDADGGERAAFEGELPPPEPSLGKVLLTTLAHFGRTLLSVFTFKAFRSRSSY